MAIVGGVGFLLLSPVLVWLAIVAIKVTRFDENVVPPWYSMRDSTWPRFVRLQPLMYATCAAGLVFGAAHFLAVGLIGKFGVDLLALLPTFFFFAWVIPLQTGRPRRIAYRRPPERRKGRRFGP